MAVVAPTVLAVEVAIGACHARRGKGEGGRHGGGERRRKDHTVTADDGSFDSGNLPDGKTFRHTFKKPGKYKYHCEYHPRDKAVVVVE